MSSEFQRVGEYGRVPVYKLIGGSDDLIYVPSKEGGPATDGSGSAVGLFTAIWE